MTSISQLRRHLGAMAMAFTALGLLGTAAAAATTEPAALPKNSIYQLALPLADQDGRNFTLAERKGQPVLISMFYTSCQFVCPMLIEAIRITEARLSEAERANLTVLMVSIDPAHDSVAVLKSTSEKRELPSPHWTLARTDAKNVRKLAAVLGIQYRALPDGDFNHTTAIILLDADGRIAGRTSQMGSVDPAFLKLVKANIQAKTP
jgi:protein SCO1/2